jgi:hypothetical protein
MRKLVTIPAFFKKERNDSRAPGRQIMDRGRFRTQERQQLPAIFAEVTLLPLISPFHTFLMSIT